MIKTFLMGLTLYGISSNLIIMNPAGVLNFQREKRYLSFRFLSAIFVSLGITICSLCAYLLQNYLIKPQGLQDIYVSLVLIIVLLYNLLISFIFSKKSEFNHYLYETSLSYVFDSVLIMSSVLIVDMNLEIAKFAVYLLSIMISSFLSIMIVGFYVCFNNKSYINPEFRKVPTTLFLLSIFSILLYYLGILV